MNPHCRQRFRDPLLLAALERRVAQANNKSGKCAVLSIPFRFDERYSELERCEGRRALLAAKEFSPIEAFSEAQLSAFAPTRHASHNPYPRIADISNGSVWANAKAVQAPSTVRLAIRTHFEACREPPSNLKNHPLPCILIGHCFCQHVGSIPWEHRRLYAWSFASSEKLE